MDTPLRILLIEDSEDDAFLVSRALHKLPKPVQIHRVESSPDFKNALHAEAWDLILSDYNLPHFSGPAALDLLHELKMDIPFLVVSGAIGEEPAAELMRRGAKDFIRKDRLERLVPAIERELVDAEIRRQHRAAEAALRERESFLAHLMRAIPIPLFYKDLHGKFLGCNRAFEEFVGISAEHLRGKTVFEVYPKDLAELYDLKDRELLAQGGIQRYECQVEDRSGARKDIITNKSVFRDALDRPVGTLGTILDITEKKRHEEARLAMERQLLHAQRLESLGVLAGGIAHDFNNLLMAILGNLDIALLELSPLSQAKPFVEEAMKASRRATDLTRQMLAYSGKGLFKVQKMDLNAQVQENSHLFRAAIPRTIQMSLELWPHPLIIQADPGQIQQVIMNLITNAAEAITGPGHIQLLTRWVRLEAYELEASLLMEKAQPGPFACLEVSDNGCGMTQDVLDKIFDPFFTTKFTGRGLGMAALMGIVKSHQGAIFIQSQPGQGTSFQIHFPALEQPPSTYIQKSQAFPTPTERIVSLLLVDDEPSVLKTGKAQTS